MRWMVAILWLVGCGNAPNGESCDDNGDCSSSYCQGNICNSGKCSVPGASCGDADGWECVQHDTFFGPIYGCELLCAQTEPTCPQWYSCIDDKHCTYGSADITYSPTEIVARQPVTFTAHLFADRTPEMASWLFELNGASQQFVGTSATVTFSTTGSVRAGFLVKYAGEAREYQATVRLTVH